MLCSEDLQILTHFILMTSLGGEDHAHFQRGKWRQRKENELTQAPQRVGWQSRNLDSGWYRFKYQYKQFKEDLNKATDEDLSSSSQENILNSRNCLAKMGAGYVRHHLAKLWEAEFTATAYSQELEKSPRCFPNTCFSPCKWFCP